jgi:Tfp pilus assembly protein PilV
MRKKYFHKNKKKSGFSFLETIISVFLIAIGMIAVMALMASSLKESFDSRDQVIATLLSQEGIELVRNVRDNNWANDLGSFDAGFPSASKVRCQVDAVTDAISCPAFWFSLKLNTDGIYNYSSGSATRFQRKIMIQYDNDTEKNLATITSIVAWGSDIPALSSCNSANKCAYSKTVLGRWGEN